MYLGRSPVCLFLTVSVFIFGVLPRLCDHSFNVKPHSFREGLRLFVSDTHLVVYGTYVDVDLFRETGYRYSHRFITPEHCFFLFLSLVDTVTTQRSLSREAPTTTGGSCREGGHCSRTTSTRDVWVQKNSGTRLDVFVNGFSVSSSRTRSFVSFRK